MSFSSPPRALLFKARGVLPFPGVFAYPGGKRESSALHGVARECYTLEPSRECYSELPILASPP